MSAWKFLWLLAPALGLFETGAHFYFAKRPPTLEEWNALKPKLADLRRERELVVPAPGWTDPLARHAFGDELMPLADVARPDESAYRQALEISILGERASELRSWRELERHELGRFTIRRLENPAPADVRFDFVDGFDPARVSVSEAPGRACRFNREARVKTGGLHGHMTFPRERFECPAGEYFFVGVTIADDQRYRPRRCIWAHPTSGELSIVYENVQLGRVIAGHAGLSYFLWRDGLGAPVELSIAVDGDLVGTVVHREENGWARFETALGRHAGTTARVEFRVTSARIADRHFCFHADTR